ncbi:MAG TPA: TMEM175 family protein [Streptosporangiaceae bacterium]|nr:TMEM175 family protein [Streptosporangiaceae bacterium]
MPADQDTPREGRSPGTARLAAFSDGVLAIAATLLVLDIVVQPPGAAAPP